MPAFYGLARAEHLYDVVAAACRVLGEGENNSAVSLLLETAAQETRLGTFRDPTPNGAGRGVFQCDPIGLQDVQARTKPADVAAIKTAFNFDLTQLNHTTLDVSPMAAAVVARLFYKLVPAPIPTTLAGRAQYWKTHYNTAAGKGTVGEYMRNAAAVDYAKVLRATTA